MGLTAGPVPHRVSGPVKQTLVALTDDATAAGFSLRWACRQLGVDHARLLSWKRRHTDGTGLADIAPGPERGQVLHALLE